jgi:hypothetical protein
MNDFFLEASKIIVAALFAITGWTITMLVAKIEESAKKHDALQKELEAHKFYSATHYVTKLDIKDIRDEIVGHLKSIEEKLDKKADK